MKRRITINLIITATLAVVRLLSFPALAGVPVEWSVDVSRVEPVRLDAYHGETLDLSAALLQGRRPLAIPAGTATFLWQTNGMGAAWWQTNATVSADGVVRGTFCPLMDTGADAVRFFFSVVSGSGANYRAAGTIALRASPGATPTTADLAPQTAINFADYQLVNAPWITAVDAAESVRAATNALATAMQASDNALSNAISDAARAATNYADSVATAGRSALVTATNALVAGGVQLVATAAQAATNYTDAAVASISIPSLTGYATEAWVMGRGYLTDHQSLSGYATEEWTRQAISNALPVVPSLAGYATEAWVQGRGYLTSHQPLTGYATEAWVQGRGYLTDHQSLAGYATEDWTRQAISNALPVVPSLAGYATEAWVTNRGYLTSHQPLTGYATEAWVQGRGYLTDHQSLAGYATEAYATDAATGAREAAEAYARNLAWAASSGNTRLVSLDGETWQDATGTVWRMSGVYGWRGTVIDLPTTTARAIQFDPVPGSPTTWSAGGGTNLMWDTMSWILEVTNALTYADIGPTLSATNLTFETNFEKYYLYYGLVALETNPVDRVMYASSGSSAGETLRLATPDGHTWQDATGCVWKVQTIRVCTDSDEEWTYTVDGQTYTREQMIEAAGDYSYSQTLYWGTEDFIGKDGEAYNAEGWFVADGSGTAPVGYDFTTGIIPDYALDPYLAEVSYYGNITATRGTLFTVTNLINRVAYTNDIPDTASITSDLADLRTESSLVYRLYSGSNVVAEVTNYNSQVHAPALRLMQLNESNEYGTVWTETNGLSRTYREATNYAAMAVADYAAPRAWSKTTSGLGADAPPDTTWVSTPRTVIAGGLEYAKVVDTFGEVWVLSSNGMAANFNPDTNAYFRITADDGTDIFSIEKTDAQVVGADADGITVGESTVVIPVGVVSAEHPTMFWRQALGSGSWADESTPPTGATVTWSGGTGAWVCTITWSGTRPSSMFFRFTFLQEGGVVIRNHATSDISAGIYVNGVKFIPSVSGNNLIWTKQQ